jgi:hypothetical protein
MKKLLMVMPGLSTLACAMEYNSRYYYNEIQVVNLTSMEIADVEVGLVGTPMSLTREEVLKNAMCADRYGRRLYPQQGIELSWIHTDGSQKAELFSSAIPVTYNSAFPIRIVMEINADGSVKPFYEQEEPGRGLYDY